MISSLLSAAAGALTWTVAEHLIHHGLGHKYAKNRNFFAVEHVRHHATTSYFASSLKKLAGATVATAVMAPVASLLVGTGAGLAFTAGLVTMYGSYEVLHRRAHTHPPRDRYGRWLRKHHFHHHFHNPKVNHGVTSPLWDHLFGTYEPVGVVRVPERHAMPWLVDPDTGDVWPAFREDYALSRKRGARPPRDDDARSNAHATSARAPRPETKPVRATPPATRAA